MFPGEHIFSAFWSGTSASNKIVLSALVAEGDLVLFDRNNHKAAHHGALFLGGAIPILCQAIAWWSIYGSPFGPVTGGGNLGGTTWTPFQRVELWNVLASSYHGLFTWSPVVILAIAGCAGRFRTHGTIDSIAERRTGCRPMRLGGRGDPSSIHLLSLLTLFFRR